MIGRLYVRKIILTMYPAAAIRIFNCEKKLEDSVTDFFLRKSHIAET